MPWATDFGMRSILSSVSTLLLLLGCGKADPPAPGGEAPKLLADAGYPGGKGFPKLTLTYNRGDVHHKIATAVQEMWRTRLGIEVELRNMEFTASIEQVDRGDFEIARRAWIGEYTDPHAFLDLFTRDSHSNPTGWGSDEYERLIGSSQVEPDPGRRLEILARAERLLVEEAPFIPIYHYVAHNYMKPFIRGVHHNVRDMHPLQNVRLEGEGAPGDGVLVFNSSEEPGTIDPALSRTVLGVKILMHLFEGLLSYDPKDASPAPGLAERWEVSPEGTTWTFHLRPGSWSSGDPVTAHDFVYAWRRVADPKTGSTYAHRMYLVKNAREIVQGRAKPETLGIRALDERTLEVELMHRAPYFPQLLCLSLFYPVHRATVEKHGAAWTRPENIVHNGPYRIASWIPHDRKVFEKNPRYRDAAGVTLEKFVFLSITDDATAFQAFESGQCHWLFRAPLERMEQLQKRPGYMRGPYNGSYFYVFNTRKKPLDDVRVRKALSLAVDRDIIAGQILRGGETPAARLVPPTSLPPK